MVEFQVVTKDDLGTAARSQSHLVGVLHHCHVVADEAVPQRVLFPLHSGLKRNSPVGEITRAGCSSWIPASRRMLGKWACRCTCTNLASTKWPTKYSPSVTKNPFAWTPKSDRLPGQALGLAPPSWSFGGFCKSSNPSTSKASIKSSDPRPPS